MRYCPKMYEPDFVTYKYHICYLPYVSYVKWTKNKNNKCCNFYFTRYDMHSSMYLIFLNGERRAKCSTFIGWSKVIR